MKALNAIFAASLLLGLAPTSAATAKDADLWRVWLAHDAKSSARIDHSAWTAFLRAYLRSGPDRVTRVAYGRVTAADKAALAAYLDRLSNVAISRHARPVQLAYWINLYNALTVKVVLDRWPVKSIRDISISPGLFARGPWGKKLIAVEGRALSLDDIEHRILRPIWRDPRIHYAVNCASIGCPNLAAVAYTADNADRLLSGGAVAYINHPRGVQVSGNRLVVSRIYRWFRADFGGSEAAVIAHLKRYAKQPLRAKLEGRREIDGYRYDWSINAAR